MKLRWKIGIGIIVAAGLFVTSGVYAGHREGSEALREVRGRLDSNGETGLQVIITSYHHAPSGFRYVCGMVADISGAKVKRKHSFIVGESGIFPSAFMVSFSEDIGFDDLCRANCK
ncbi:MAG: hypothetical protein WB870_09570 [Gallionellaceae bacterium]